MKDVFIWHQNKARSIKKSETVLLTVLNVHIFQILKGKMAQLYQKSLLRSDWLHSNHLIYNINREICKMQNLLQPLEVSDYMFHSFVISSTITGKTVSFTVRWSFISWHSMLKDGLISKFGWKMLSMCITLKVPGCKYLWDVEYAVVVNIPTS